MGICHFYGYNDRNELVSAGRDALVASAPEYEYSYDDIGNRLSSIEAGTVNVDLLDALDLGWKILADCFNKGEVGIPSKMSDKYWPKS